MLKRYKVVSGEFSLVIREKDFESAALRSIHLHSESGHHSCLGQITMVESSRHATKYFFTEHLIEDSRSSSYLHSISCR